MDTASPINTPTILVVEESEITSRVMTSILGKAFTVVQVGSGDECLQKVKDINPTTIFMDVNLPDRSGFEACRSLKDDPGTNLIPVIFISEQSSIQEKMMGYDAGGDDFPGIPFHPPELLAKARVSIEHHQHIHSLEDKVHDLAAQADYASKAAFAAMRSNSDLGVINQFTRSSYLAKDFYELSGMLFQAMHQWGLFTTVQFRACHQVLDITEADYVPPLEKELLTTLADHGRIVEFGRRAVFNYEHVSLLIKNLPNDNLAVGLLRDSIATLAEGMEAKVCALHREHLLRSERDKHLLMLNQVQEGFKKHEQMTMKIMDDLTRDMQNIFDTLGLSENEEREFNGLLGNAFDNLTQLYANGVKIDSEFVEALNKLQHKADPLQARH